jgi:predicted transposase/invertase (TIGR01784 family)
MVKFKKLREKDIRNDPLHRWLSWFDKDSSPELVAEVVKMDTAIQKAQERTDFVSADKEALRAYQMREMALSDYTSGINHAKREGIKEGKRDGIKEGKAEGIKEVARRMKSRNVPVGQIAEDTGLTAEEIAGL